MEATQMLILAGLAAPPTSSGVDQLVQTVLDWVTTSIPIVITVVFLAAILAGVRITLRRQAQGKSDTGFRQQLTMFVASLLAIVVVILNLPVDADTRTQLLRIFGLLLSGAIALSSTTILGNMMAGLMLRAVDGFRPGDYLRCGEIFGRVTERGLLHTEVQTEQSDLTTLPNLYLVTTPYSVVRAGGTILEARVSLGYDVPRRRAEELLLEAAGELELEQPFVHVLELGDFSVTYRVGGLLREIKHLLSKRSLLRTAMLDRLHAGGVEIASPTLMSTRAFDKRDGFVPPVESSPESAPNVEEGEEPSFEEVAFEKADKAATVEEIEESLVEIRAELVAAREAAKKDKREEGEVAAEVQRLETRVERQTLRLERRRKELEEDPEK